jgi:hypothetical protein
MQCAVDTLPMDVQAVIKNYISIFISILLE